MSMVLDACSFQCKHGSLASERNPQKQGRREHVSAAFTCRPSSVGGWVGKFVSFAPTGVSEDDIRFQDVWLRTFQERSDVDGKFHMRMIRRADQANKSWPRGGIAESPLIALAAACQALQVAGHMAAAT